MSDDEQLYLSQEAFDRQTKLVPLDDDELLTRFGDVVLQICVRQRMRPRDLFQMFLAAQEELMESLIPVMAEALESA